MSTGYTFPPVLRGGGYHGRVPCSCTADTSAQTGWPKPMFDFIYTVVQMKVTDGHTWGC